MILSLGIAQSLWPGANAIICVSLLSNSYKFKWLPHVEITMVVHDVVELARLLVRLLRHVIPRGAV